MDREQDTLRTGRPAHSDGQTSDAILRDIERTRGAMDHTLDALAERIHPRQLLDDAVDLFRSDSAAGQKFRRNAQEWGGRAWGELRDNPVPALLIGAGIAWLAFGSRREERDLYYPSHAEMERPDFTTVPDDFVEMDADYDMDTYVGSCPTGIGEANPSGEEIDDALTSRVRGRRAEEIGRDEKEAHGRLRRAGEAAREKGREVGDALREKATGAKDRMRSGASKAESAVADAGHAMRSSMSEGRQRAGDRMHAMRESASSMGYRARDRGRRMQQHTMESMRENYDVAREQAREAVDEYPMAVAAGALAMGLLAGVLAPRTRHEDRLMGARSDQMKDTARAVASETVERAKETATASAAAAANAMQDEGLAPDQVAEKVSRVASEVTASAKESLKDENLSAEELKEKLRHVGEDAMETAKSEMEKHRSEMSEERYE